MIKVAVRNNNVEGALKTIKNKNAKNGLLKKYKERKEGYLKPGVKRKIEEKENKINWMKKNKNRY